MKSLDSIVKAVPGSPDLSFTFTEEFIDEVMKKFNFPPFLRLSILSGLNYNLSFFLWLEKNSNSGIEFKKIRNFLKKNIELIKKIRKNFQATNSFSLSSRYFLQNSFADNEDHLKYRSKGSEQHREMVEKKFSETQQWIQMLEKRLKDFLAKISYKGSGRKKRKSLYIFMETLIDTYKEVSGKEATTFYNDIKGEYEGEFYEFSEMIIKKMNENGCNIRGEIGGIIISVKKLINPAKTD